MTTERNTVLTLDQFRAIEWHTNEMIAAAEKGRQTYLAIPSAQRSEQVMNMIAYWKNVIAGLKWSLGLARQRCPACRNV